MTTPVELRCEHSVNPLGLNVTAPRFSWRCAPGQIDASQAAYRILVASSVELLAKDSADLWDSGRVDSGQSSGIAYAGEPLNSRRCAHWKVCVWNQDGKASEFSESAFFEMALLDASDWSAEWVGSPAGQAQRARYFRCEFELPAAVTRARLYVTGLGYYEAFVNGVRAGDAVLEPAYTDVTQRVLYATHDVTGNLRAGKNVLAAAVGAGWHGQPLFFAQLEIECAGGFRETITTDRRKNRPAWLVSGGPIVAASVFDGETYDARLEKTGWNLPEHDVEAASSRGEAWTQVFAMRSPGGKLQAHPLEPIKVIRELTVQAITQPRPGVFVFDFGQNHAGWARLRVRGSRGTAIVLKYAELLSADGTVNQENLRTALATDTYILKGGGEEHWSPAFTYHGYRYVEVHGWPGTPDEASLVACVVRSAVTDRGEFSCDHPLLNRIHALVRWTEESNLHGIPTDCPQRNERMGWLNDLAARAEELVHNFEVGRLLEKFTTDIRDAQDAHTGALSDTVPFHWGRQPADPVSVCFLLIPWLLHTHSGDTRVLRENFAAMRRWVEFLTTRSKEGIVDYSYYGDWAPPAGEAVRGSIGSGAISAKTPGALISTAYYFYAASLLEKIAGVLGENADVARFSELAREIRAAFQRHFWSESTDGYGSGNQACNAIALYLGLVPAELKSRVVASLVRDVAKHDYHLTTGNLCSKYLLEVLSAEGHAEAALAIATQTSYPGWGYMLANGATTLWERWELMTGGGMNSHNHPMLGAVGSWLYRWVAGLAVEEPRGGRGHFVFQPPVVGLLTHARAKLPTVWGVAEISWRITGRQMRVEMEVPWNCTAKVRLPETPEIEIGSGRRVYVIELAVEPKFFTP